MNQAKAIREELAWIGRYLDGISPKLAKYKELTERKEFLRKELKKLSDRQSGVDPKPMKKMDNTVHDIVGNFIEEKRNKTSETYRKSTRSYKL